MVTRRIALGLVSTGLIGASAAKAQAEHKSHRVALHVDQNDAAIMNLALNNAVNLAEYYQHAGDDLRVEIVAYGPGLHMLREDTSPVKARIASIAKESWPSTIAFSACANTRENMEKQEGHPIPILQEAQIVPSGVVRLSELQEDGWSYVKP